VQPQANGDAAHATPEAANGTHASAVMPAGGEGDAIKALVAGTALAQ
jgi:hypothetical protein